jgi:hypothetical protein
MRIRTKKINKSRKKFKNNNKKDEYFDIKIK